MDLIIDLWTYSPGWRLKLLLASLSAIAILIMVVMVATGRARTKAGREGRITAATYAITGKDEPEDLAIYTRAVANLFETPMIFMVLVLAFVTVQIESWLTVLLAWLFVTLRCQHAWIMLNGNRVMRRRKAFFRSIYVLMALVAEFTISLIFFAEL